MQSSGNVYGITGANIVFQICDFKLHSVINNEQLLHNIERRILVGWQSFVTKHMCYTNTYFV